MCRLLSEQQSTKMMYNYHMEKSSEAVTRRCCLKNVFLQIAQNSQESICAGVYFQISCRPNRHNAFSVNFVKFLKTPFFIEHLPWLLLRETRLPRKYC